MARPTCEHGPGICDSRRRRSEIPGRITPFSGSRISSFVFMLFPLVIWTGLAMAPGFTAVLPWSGRQPGRTSVRAHAALYRHDRALSSSLFVHVTMIILAGFRWRVARDDHRSGGGTVMRSHLFVAYSLPAA